MRPLQDSAQDRARKKIWGAEYLRCGERGTGFLAHRSMNVKVALSLPRRKESRHTPLSREPPTDLEEFTGPSADLMPPFHTVAAVFGHREEGPARVPIGALSSPDWTSHLVRFGNSVDLELVVSRPPS